MTSLMEQLHDIEGLDPISPWPLAIGWWICIGFGILLLGSGIWLLKRRLAYLRSWQRDAFKKLDHLEQNLSPSNSMETVAFLSEYLRRIALHRYPRNECAGLVGDAWLKWLKAHDPKQFNWTEKAKALSEIPYAPTDAAAPSEQNIKELIQAIRNWVH